MEIDELMICNVQASNLGKYQDAPNFEASEMSYCTGTVNETDRNALSAISGCKFEYRLKCFPESNFQQTFLMQVFSNTNRSLSQLKNTFREEASTALYTKSKFDTQIAKDVYVCSTFLSCRTLAVNMTSITITLPIQPPTEALLIKTLRIVDIPSDYEIHYRRVMLDAGFEFPSYTCIAKNGYAASMITDLPALQPSHPSTVTPVCTLKSFALTRFYESSTFCSRTLISLPTSYHQSLHEFLIEVNSFASNLKKTLLLYDTNKLTKREMIGFQALSRLVSHYIHCIDCLMSLFGQENGQAPMLALASVTLATSCIVVCNSLSLQSCSMHTSTMSIGIPLKIKELLQALQSEGDELITNINFTSIASLNDKERIEGSLLCQYGYVIPCKMSSTSVTIVSPSSAIQSPSQLNKSMSGTSVAISRANPSTNQVKVHSSLSLIPVTTVTSCKDYFEKCFDILSTISPQYLLSYVPIHPICTDVDLEQFEGLQLLSLVTHNCKSVQFPI